MCRYYKGTDFRIRPKWMHVSISELLNIVIYLEGFSRSFIFEHAKSNFTTLSNKWLRVLDKFLKQTYTLLICKIERIRGLTANPIRFKGVKCKPSKRLYSDHFNKELYNLDKNKDRYKF